SPRLAAPRLVIPSEIKRLFEISLGLLVLPAKVVSIPEIDQAIGREASYVVLLSRLRRLAGQIDSGLAVSRRYETLLNSKSAFNSWYLLLLVRAFSSALSNCSRALASFPILLKRKPRWKITSVTPSWLLMS